MILHGFPEACIAAYCDVPKTFATSEFFRLKILSLPKDSTNFHGQIVNLNGGKHETNMMCTHVHENVCVARITKKSSILELIRHFYAPTKILTNRK